MGKAVLGREAEFEAVERFLERMRTEQAALVVEGEAGIGKTTVWLEAVQQAEARAFRVLQARPAESEAQHSYAALADLLANVFDELRVALPAVQEGALAAALLRAEPDAVAEPRTTATGFVGILTGLAEQSPVVVAIDDAQWLDSASEAALVFAARRLPPRLGLLVTRRTQGRVELPLGLGRALPEDGVERVVPGPLSLAGLHELVDDRLGWSLPRPLLARLADASGGNPFFALEIARDLAEDGARHAAGEPLPVPPNLEELVAGRVGGLSEGATQAVLVAAALSRPTTAAIADALQSEESMRAALVEAEEAGVLVSDGDRIRFAHPLLASAAYGAASPERRRQLHERLAAVVPDPEERARHLALSATGADETIAAELEQAAQQAARRGAQQAAAELYQASRRLTPDDRGDELARRELGQASALLAGGDIDGARSLAERAAASPAAELRAEALYLLAEIHWVAGSFQGASEHLQQALAAAPDDPQLAARVYPRLVYVHAAHDPARASKLVPVAVEALDPERSPAELGSVLVNQFWVELMLGEAARPELLEQWRELEERAGPEARKSLVPLIYYHSVDDFAAARARHAVEDEWYRVRGEDDWRAERQAHRAFAEFRAGEWDEAERLVEEACSVIAKSERPGPWTMAFRFRALVDAGRGRTGRARATLLPLIEEAERSARFWWEALLLSALAFVEFSAGDHRAVDQALTRMWECLDPIGTRDMVPDRSEPFLVESLVALGEPARARAVLERLEERGRVFPRLWITATLPRTRALVLAAEGDVPAALAALDELDQQVASQLPLDLGWTLLVQGRLLRRARQRRAAAQALQRSLELFEGLGAPDWEERARTELDRVGLRRAPKELTASELRVAELVASGLTNRDVAAKAFMSTKTVEAHLARVYRKLGIHSRAELGARIGDGRATSTEPPKPRPTGGRELATLLFTDLVGSTEKARTLGDAAWATLLARHNEAVRRELARYSGEEIDTAGDGFLVLFDGPARAINCALAIREGLRPLELEVRAGVHTGEVERRPGDKPRGIAVHACSRIMSLAGAGEILVSSTTRELVDGSGIEFEDRGEHELRGIAGARRVFAAG